MDNGAIFTYKNDFGGEWSEDPKKPFQGGGRAQAWSPSIGRNETWTWGKDIIRGVNLGGWLVTEPFVSPALYEKYVNKTDIYIADEWTLCLAMGADGAEELEGHYKTFIRSATSLRSLLPASTGSAFPSVSGPSRRSTTSHSSLEQAGVTSSRRWSGRASTAFAFTWTCTRFLEVRMAGMHGTMGLANAQRTITYLRILVEFVSQAQYREVVPIVGIVNEILWSAIGETGVKSWYQVAYDTIRESTGMGEGPYIVVHDGFQGPPKFEGFMEGADRLILDQHPYIAFQNDHTSSMQTLADRPCDWAIATNQSSKVFGITLGGEFSAAINDCGYWLSGIGSVPGYPDCGPFDDWHNYNDTIKGVLNDMALASMDALQNWFFWTWKIGNSTTLGTSSSPMWHYKLGLQEGWIPKDPRSAIGHCAAKLGKTQEFDGNYPASATGQGNGTLASTVDFPPHTMEPSFTGTQIALLPTYTPTGTVHSLFGPTFTAAPSAVVGTGWNNTADTQMAYVPVSGCAYP
ncbi:glycoside hydrolase family 5 protein, partial [Schizophyllum commune]